MSACGSLKRCTWAASCVQLLMGMFCHWPACWQAGVPLGRTLAHMVNLHVDVLWLTMMGQATRPFGLNVGS